MYGERHRELAGFTVMISCLQMVLDQPADTQNNYSTKNNRLTLSPSSLIGPSEECRFFKTAFFRVAYLPTKAKLI